MIKSCLWCKNNFEITNNDLQFYDKISPVFQGKKYAVPPPTLCPDCRMQRRLSWRNGFQLYNRICDHCKKPMVSIFSPDKTNVVFCRACWWSDQWDPLDYGQEINWNRPFFEQFAALMKRVPLFALDQENNENCDYTCYTVDMKNCYLLFDGYRNENCYYAQEIQESRLVVDSLGVRSSQIVYDSVDCEGCYDLFHSQKCLNCRESRYLYNCTACSNCLFSANLKHKEYHIFNQPVSKTEYEQFRENLQTCSSSELRRYLEKYNRLLVSSPRLFQTGVNNENCSGDDLLYSKNCTDSYRMTECRDAKYVWSGRKSHDIMDIYLAFDDTQLTYDCLVPGLPGYMNLFSDNPWRSTEQIYAFYNFSSKACFGCAGLKSKQYCILNKQYTQGEYEAIVPRLIEVMTKYQEWGEFFSPAISPFGYNETLAQQYFPLTRENVLGKDVSVEPIHELVLQNPTSDQIVETQNFAPLHEGNEDTNHGNLGDADRRPLQKGPIFQWSDYERPQPDVEKIITADQMQRLPENIKDIPDDILNWALTCEVTGKLYRIIKQELQFYREHAIPVPKRHPDQRYLDRMDLRNPRKLWKRQCDCENDTHNHIVGDAHVRPLQNKTARCPTMFQTTYAPEGPEKVYCENCYLKEIY